MHFYVNLVGFITPCYSCLPFLILALSTISFIGFWQVAEGTCFGLFLSDLWDSADIQESTAKSVAHIQAPVLRCKSTSAELKFLDKSYLWRNKRRQYFVGPWCTLPGSNIWRFYAKGQIIFKHLIFYGCDRERDACFCCWWWQPPFIEHVPYTKQFALIYHHKIAREMLLYPF